MRTTSSSSASISFHKAYMLAAIAAVTMLLLLVPRQAHAQGDALRVLAGRVLQGSVYDRDGVYGREGVYDRDVYAREQRARAEYCRTHPNDYRCDSMYGNEARRGAWCLDRNRDNRCDAGRREVRHDNGRRGWWNDDDYDDHDRGRRGWKKEKSGNRGRGPR